MKKLSSLILVLVLCLSVSFAAFASASDENFANSDAQSLCNGIFYDIDESNGRVYTENEKFEKNWFTLYSVSGIASHGNKLFVSKSNKIRCINPKTGKDTVFCRFDDTVKCFSVNAEGVYALCGDTVYFATGSKNIKTVVTDGKIKSFWLESENEIVWKLSTSRLCVLNTENGEKYYKDNNYSSLGDDIPVYAGGAEGVSKNKMNLTSLQSKFPAGAYWNHAGSYLNNPDGTTQTPCTHHPSDSGCSFNGSCGCNSFSNSIQCAGYAFKCGNDVTGYNPKTVSGGWSVSTDSSKLNNLKAGDIIRYRNDGHSIYVTGVDGEDVYFTDCNWGHQCKIRWDAHVEKSTLRSSFTKIYIGPYDVGAYTIKLDLNGGDSCSKSSIKVDVGAEYGELPIPEKEGYDFLGWFTQASGGTQILPTTVAKAGSVTTTIYAHWQIKTYTVTYDANGGTDAPDMQSKKFGETITLTHKEPKRNGYTFDCWNTKADGSGTDYKKGRQFNENRTLYLYAKWIGDKHRIAFDPNGGSLDLADRDRGVSNGDKYTSLPVPTLRGYQLDGWFTQPEGGTQVKEGDLIELFRNITLYAHWSLRQVKVTFDADGGETNFDELTVTYSKTYGELPTCKKKGYTFLGWYTQRENGTMVFPNDVIDREEDYTLYALFSINSYTITFDADGGECDATSKKLVFGSSWGKLPETTKEGCIFLGWYNSATGYLVSDYGTVNFDENVTFKARWKALSFTVILNPMGGQCDYVSFLNECYSAYGKLPTPERDGYAFLGWYTEILGGEQIKENTPMTIIASHTLYAHWESLINEIPGENEFTLTFVTCRGESTFKYHEGELVVFPVPDCPDYYACKGFDIPMPAIMPACNLTLTAVYEPIKYPAYYYSGNSIVAVREFTCEQAPQNEPEVTNRNGYNGYWSMFVFAPGSVKLTQCYEPIQYSITFRTDKEIADVQYFTVLTDKDEIELPPVPEIKGFEGQWSDFALKAENIVVYAKYTCVAEIAIRGYVPKRWIDYHSTIIFDVNLESDINGCEIHWFLNKNDMGIGNPDGTFTVKDVEGMFSVQAKLMRDDEVLKESETEKVFCNNGFFKKLIAFFRKLFNRLPVIVQGEE